MADNKWNDQKEKQHVTNTKSAQPRRKNTEVETFQESAQNTPKVTGKTYHNNYR